jgi:hypothetical protein
VKTLFFEGVEGMRQAYGYRHEELAGSEFVGFYGSAIRLDASLENIIAEWNAENTRMHITSRTLVPNDPSLRTFRALDKKHLRSVKKIPADEYTSELSIEITSLFVRISLYGEKQSIILEGSSVVLTFRQIFEMLWKLLPQKISGYLPENNSILDPGSITG